jgi:hypothetical protein
MREPGLVRVWKPVVGFLGGFTLVWVIWVTFMGGFWKDTPTYRVRDKNHLLLIREERSDDRSRFTPV